MSAPVEKPAVCGECVEFRDPPVPYNEKGDTYTCDPRGTRWRLTRKATQKACGTCHARKRLAAGDGQVSML